MNTVFIIILLIAGIPLARWRKTVIKARSVSTRLSPTEVRGIFERTVATSGWKIVQSGEPTIARSPAIVLRQQEITLALTTSAGQTLVKVFPSRYRARWGGPSKALTLDLRIRKFLSEVAASSK